MDRHIAAKTGRLNGCNSIFCFRGRTAFCPDLQSGISANAPTHRVHITDDDDDTTTTTTAALDTDICFPVEML